MGVRLFSISLALIALLHLGCRDNEQWAGSSTVVMLTIDTWRRDATGFLGGLDPSPTPFLDDLARRGLVASDAVSPVPLTGPSHWSMLTGRWPWRDGVRVNGDRPRGEVPTLASGLRATGWRTAAFVSCAALDRRLGFAEGFDHYDDRFPVAERTDLEMAERRADATVSRVLDWVAGQDRSARLFLWVHLFDPHFPYEPPAGPLVGERGAYLGEVAFADEQARRLMTGLQRLGRAEQRSLWLVLSDHGEGLGDHGAASHGMLLHGAATRIPLLVAGRDVPAGEQQALSSTVDVLPTIAQILDLELPASDGRSLLADVPEGERYIPLESLLGLRAFGLAPVRGLRSERWLWESSPADHLWDLSTDPLEETDVALTRPEIVQRMQGAWAAMSVPEPERGAAVPLELRRQLEALGYLSSGAPAEGRGDAREFVRTGEPWHTEVKSRQKSGDLDGAEEYARRFLEEYPQAPVMWVEAGFVAVARGDFEEAERRFRRATQIDPDDNQARLNLANALWMNGRLDAAVEHYRTVLGSDPEDPFALYNLGAVLEQMADHRQAAEVWRRFLSLHPGHPKAAEVSGRLRGWRARGLI